MRHIGITQPINGLSAVMVTQSSNSFGDQVLELKILAKDTHYETVKTLTCTEGDWYSSDTQIKNWAMQSMQFIFLDWTNDFLSVPRPRFAEYYQISENAAHTLINEGRIIHESLVKQIKSKEKK